MAEDTQREPESQLFFLRDVAHKHLLPRVVKVQQPDSLSETKAKWLCEACNVLSDKETNLLKEARHEAGCWVREVIAIVE